LIDVVQTGHEGDNTMSAANTTLESSPAAGATPYEELRQRHVQEMWRRAGAHLERLGWPAERLRAEREVRLRTLVWVARERSPWHRARLAHVDVDSLGEEDLGRIPVMTKADLMEHFDGIVTDPRLTLARVESHLAGLTSPAYLFDQYQAVASGGSTGHRGVFVYGWDAWADLYLSLFRYLIRARASDPELAARPMVGAVVAAAHATHVSSSCPRTFSDPAVLIIHRFPITESLDRIVTGLNDARPDILIGYASALQQLAFAQEGSALRITPRIVVTSGEPLLPEIRSTLEATWPVPLHNWWAASEGGGMGISCGEGLGMHLSDDLLIIEPVGRPVPAGVCAAKIYLTNLYNLALPLIRYEATDEVTLLDEPCACGSAYRLVADVQGRLDDWFVYPGAGPVHPHVFRSQLWRDRNVMEYQVRQTERGAEIAVRCRGHVHLAGLRTDLVEDLKRLGLQEPEVSITAVDRLERQGVGKLKRFIRLSSTPASAESHRIDRKGEAD
jgi:phenylacetate-coenzyme A ligase PaaK-like adenylate-forming protein